MTSGLLLAIESATRRASVALLDGDVLLAELEGDDGDHHAERLLPMIDGLLAGAGVELARVGAFAVSIGPGAFTSLRIGLATLKGLAFDTDKQVAAVSTLHALAEAALEQGRIEAGELCVPLLDARRGELYGGVYRRTAAGGLEPAIDDFVYRPEELAALIAGDARLVGEGASIFGEGFAAAAPAGIRVAVDDGPPVWPTARAVGRIGRAALASGRGRSVSALVPRYVRRAQAEELRTERRFE